MLVLFILHSSYVAYDIGARLTRDTVTVGEPCLETNHYVSVMFR